MRFGTWNIACGAEGYRGARLAEIAARILEENLDVCALQEVDRFAARSGFVDFPAALARHTGMLANFAPSLSFPPEAHGMPPREYGNCFLSRVPLSGFVRVPLTVKSFPEDAVRQEKEPRSALLAHWQREGEAAWVATAHLAYSPDFRRSAVRAEQAEVLARYLRICCAPSEAVIFGGDLNADADSRDLDALRADMLLVTGSLPPTWPLGGGKGDGRDPFVTIDHVFVRNARLAEARGRDYAGLSDHSLVVAEVFPVRSAGSI